MRLILLDYPASLVAPYAIVKDTTVVWKGEWGDRPDYISDDLQLVVEKNGSIDLMAHFVNDVCDLGFRLIKSDDFNSDDFNENILPKVQCLASLLRSVL